MEYLIKALRDLIPSITLYDSGSEEHLLPYATYEYNSVTFENQYQILFSIDVTSNTAYEAETLATTIKKALHNKMYYDVNVGFKVTQSPTIQVLPNQLQGIYSRRLNFTIIAYFKED